MSMFGDFLGGTNSKKSLLSQESEVESHLQVIQVWLSNELTDQICFKVTGAVQLREKLLSDTRTIVAKLRTLKLTLDAYEKGYYSITTKTGIDGKEKRESTFKAESHPNSATSAKYLIHSIDALEKNLIANSSLLKGLIKELANKKDKSAYLKHFEILKESVKLFTASFDKIEKTIDALPLIEQKSAI